jgi:flagellar hook protein FlgE
VGNNLANLNTPGFKTSVVSFHDLVTQSLGAGLGETQVGFGVGRPVTLRQFSQGAIQTTAGPMDAAIQGDGFFVVKMAGGGQAYTRGGNLQIDLSGVLTTSTGQKLQGWSTIGANGTVDTNTPIGDIVVPVGSLKAPTPTSKISLDLNLNAAGTAGPPPDVFSTSVEVVDSLGKSHNVTFTFTKSATVNQWTYSIAVPDADLTNPFTPVTGNLTFDSNGKLAAPLPTDAPPQIPITGLADGASDMTITWSLYDALRPRLTQFTQPSAVSADPGRIAYGKPHPGWTRRRRACTGAVLKWTAGRCRPTGHGDGPESRIHDRGRRQQLPAQCAQCAAGDRAPRHGRPRHRSRRGSRVLDCRYRA